MNELFPTSVTFPRGQNTPPKQLPRMFAGPLLCIAPPAKVHCNFDVLMSFSPVENLHLHDFSPGPEQATEVRKPGKISLFGPTDLWHDRSFTTMS